MLRERNGDRKVPIWVGPFEATAVAVSLEATEMPRPMTYQFTSDLVTTTGNRVAEVRITGLTEGIFYATVVIDGPAGAGEVDARPSDALNLALVTGSPIRVDPQLLEDPQSTRLDRMAGLSARYHRHRRRGSKATRPRPDGPNEDNLTRSSPQHTSDQPVSPPGARSGDGLAGVEAGGTARRSLGRCESI